MINFSLKEFVDENIQNFDPQNPQDIIKAEKLLKAESRLNNTFNINEIEEFLEYIKTQEQNFDNILNLSVIKSIYCDKYPENINNSPDLRNISENEIEKFREVFTPYLKEFISVSVRYNQWQKLIYFQQSYAQFFSMESHDFFKTLLHDKNNLIIQGITKNSDLSFFKKNYPFAVDKKFYYLQSLVDDLEFETEILNINDIVAKNPVTSIDNRLILGEILTAIFHFNSSNILIKYILKKNQKIANGWINPKKGILGDLAYNIAVFFSKDENSGLIIFLSIIIFCVYFLGFFFVVSINRKVYIFYSIVNVIAIYLAYKSINHHFGLFNTGNPIHSWGKVSAILLTTMIISFVLLFIAGLIFICIIK